MPVGSPVNRKLRFAEDKLLNSRRPAPEFSSIHNRRFSVEVWLRDRLVAAEAVRIWGSAERFPHPHSLLLRAGTHPACDSPANCAAVRSYTPAASLPV